MKYILILSILFSVQSFAQDADHYTWGFIVDNNSRPIADAAVCYGTECVLTNDSGFFRIKYQEKDMSIAMVGYKRSIERGKMKGGHIILYPQDTLTDRVIEGYWNTDGCLLGKSRLKGTIIDSKGIPIPGVRIHGKSGSATTDSLGNYVYIVRYDKEKVFFSKEGYQTVKANLKPRHNIINIKLHYVNSIF